MYWGMAGCIRAWREILGHFEGSEPHFEGLWPYFDGLWLHFENSAQLPGVGL